MNGRTENIDLELERIVFLCNAEEGNPGIYELTWELGNYDLTIEDKYRIARTLLTEILNEGLVTLEKYSDFSLNSKIETIAPDQYDKLLNNPYWWYPCNEILSIELTEQGSEFLDNISESLKTRLDKRWKGKK
ncbi:MAG: hypothetical protein ABJH05_01735 [Fulvivirga sp.]